MKPWENLGVVDTIYEEDYENTSSISTFLSPSLSSPSTPLHTRVDAWSLARGCEPDVLIRVQESCFHLHKDALTSRSIYFKRHLTGHVSQLTISPPLNITSDIFTLVADFCYGNHILITPFNVAHLRISAELLGMTELDRERNDNLRQITDSYFCRVVVVNRELTSVVFCSCLTLLPESETTACLASRCIEAFALKEDKETITEYLYEVVNVPSMNFQILLESLGRRFDSHDIMCEMINIYIEENNDKITEEEKMQICSSIDCQRLSPALLVHSVQNPKMPLEFIVRAMLVEHLNTRRSLFSASVYRQPNTASATTRPTTLGAILQRDAAIRHVAQLKAEMESTSSRIQSLEKELNSMKNFLHECEKPCNVLDSARSMSFSHSRGLPLVNECEGDNSIMKSARSSSFNCVSSRNVVERSGKLKLNVGFLSAQDSAVCDSPALTKNIGQRFMKRLKNVFGKRGSAEVNKESDVGARSTVKAIVEENVCEIRNELPFH